MAREKMVTRTIETTVCECMVVDLDYLELGIQTMILDVPEKVNEDEAKKWLDKAYKGEYTIIKVNYITHKEELLGMYEKDFIRYAMKLDNQTRKVIE